MLNKCLNIVRTLLFYPVLIGSVILYGVIITPIALLFPFEHRYKLIVGWNRFALFITKNICGIDYQFKGNYPLPAGPFVVMVKHQSTWETILLQTMFVPSATILKRELCFIPFFGWSLAALRPIAIRRDSPKAAMQQVQSQGVKKLNNGISVLIFPEGTRMAYGEVGRYAKGGATLALAADVPILPIAHNAGRYWPKKGLIKKPGKIQVVIGEPIASNDRSAAELTEACKQWIEETIIQIDSGSV